MVVNIVLMLLDCLVIESVFAFEILPATATTLHVTAVPLLHYYCYNLLFWQTRSI